MSVPPAPPALESAGAHPFSFDPPIANAGTNEWRYLRCTWSDVLVVNEGTGEQIAVPRRWVGGISAFDGGGTAIELLAQLEYRNSVVRRTEPRIIVMPVVEAAGACAQGRAAAVVPIRLDRGFRSKPARIAAAALALAMACFVLLAYLFRGEIIDSRNSVRTSARGF